LIHFLYRAGVKNILIQRGVQEIGLQIKSSKHFHPPPERDQQIKLQNRRAGIEPLIGHLKAGWQMGKTRLKTDRTGLSSAYTSVLAFNLRQLMRYQGASY
jgi:IS5 family transposase